MSDKIESLQAEAEQELESDRDFYLPEKYQLGILTDYLNSHEFDYITEGRVFCYPIDLLCVRGKTTVAIEMKSGKVSRGIEQAWRNSDFVDFSYLAVWSEQITDSLLDDVSETPVGLLSINSSVKQVSNPQSTSKQLCSKDSIISTVKKDVRDDTPI